MEIISLAPPWRTPRSVASSPPPPPRAPADACRWPTAFSLRRWENGRSRPGCLLGTTPWFERRSRCLGVGSSRLRRVERSPLTEVSHEGVWRSHEASPEEEGGAGGGGGGAAGGGEVVAARVAPEVIQGGDLEMLQDLIGAATNEALRRSRDLLTSEMGRLTGGLNLPGLSSS